MLKNKSLLVKFLILICAFCCSLALMLGVVGCADGVDGKDGVSVTKAEINADGELVITLSDGTSQNVGKVVGSGELTGKVIASMKVDGGKLVVTYTDNTTETLELPAGGVSCNHEFYEYELVEHTLAEDGTVVNGVILQVCEKDCGTAYIKEGALHVFESTVVDPTCTEEGYTANRCTICGYEASKTDIVPATGHTHDAGHFVEEAGKTICVDGGQYVYVCPDCGDVVVEEIEATGHHSLNWAIKVAPTKTAVGSVEGKCEICGAVVTKELPKLSETDYVYEVTKAKEICSDVGEATYTITLEGVTVFDVEYPEQTLTIKVSIPATNHTSGGEEIDDTLIYDLSEYPGLKFAGNSVPTCETEGAAGYFICDDCGEVIVVNVRVPHAAPENAEDITVNEQPTCTEPGERQYACAVCGETVTEEIPALGHDKEYAFVEEADGTFTLVTTCKREGCDYEAKETNLTGVEKNEVPETCTQDGSVTYTYTKDGKTYTITKVVPKHFHSLNGEKLDDSKVYDLNEYPDIKLAGNSTITCADAGSTGYFVCEECKDVIVVSVKVSHTVADVEPTVVDALPAHETEEDIALLDEGKVYLVEPTCEADGTRLYFCEVCEKWIVETAAEDESLTKLGHKYHYEFVKEENGTFTLTTTCENGCGLNTVENNLSNVDEKVTKAATCTEEGVKVYTYKKGNNTLTVTETIDKTPHILNGNEMPDNQVYFTNVPGISVAGNSAAACGEEPGTGYFTCEECDQLIVIKVKEAHTAPVAVETVVETIPAAEDAVVGTIYVVEPSCGVEGTKAYICTACGEYVTETIPALTHSYTFEVTKDPTLSAAGSVAVACENCSDVDTIALPALNATDYTKETVSAATCEAQGMDKYTYTDATYKQSFTFTVVTDKTGHDLESVVYSWIDATYEYTGSICKVCGKMVVATKEFRLLPTLTDTYLEVVDGKVIYTVTGTYKGDAGRAEHAIAFDLENNAIFLVKPEDTVIITWTDTVDEETVQYFKVTADVTDMALVAASSSWFPHLYVLGEKYADSAMKNASKAGSHSVLLGDYVYTITQKSGSPSWNMPVLSKSAFTGVVIANAKSASLVESEGKVLYAITGTCLYKEGTEDAVKEALGNIPMDLQGNPYAQSGSWSGDWTEYVPDLVKVELNAEEGTYTAYYDITDFKAFCYTAHYNGADFKPAAAYNQTLETATRTYTMVVVPGSRDGAKYWGCVGIKIVNK